MGGWTLTFRLEIVESSEQLVRLARGCLLSPVLPLLCILPGSIQGKLGGSSLGLHCMAQASCLGRTLAEGL